MIENFEEMPTGVGHRARVAFNEIEVFFTHIPD